MQKSSSDATMTGLLNDATKKKSLRNEANGSKKSRRNNADSKDVDATSQLPSGRIVGHYVLKLESKDLSTFKRTVSGLKVLLRGDRCDECMAILNPISQLSGDRKKISDIEYIWDLYKMTQFCL